MTTYFNSNLRWKFEEWARNSSAKDLHLTAGTYVHWTDRGTADSSREHTGEGQEAGEGDGRGTGQRDTKWLETWLLDLTWCDYVMPCIPSSTALDYNSASKRAELAFWRERLQFVDCFCKVSDTTSRLWFVRRFQFHDNDSLKFDVRHSCVTEPCKKCRLASTLSSYRRGKNMDILKSVGAAGSSAVITVTGM